MIEFESPGSFKKTEKFLKKMKSGDIYDLLDKYGQQGVDALSAATPRDSGLTAEQWGYKVIHKRDQHQIVWTNGHNVKGSQIAIVLQYGHGTGTGGYVAGRDYINPALKGIFDKIADDVRRAVKSA